MTTATAAGESTGATAQTARSDYHAEVTEALLGLDRLRKQIKTMQDVHDRKQLELIELLEADFDGSFRPRPTSAVFTVVRAVRKVIDQDKALDMLKRRRLFKSVTKVVVDHEKYLALVRTGVLPELSTAITEHENAPFIKIS